MEFRRPNMHLSAQALPSDFEWGVTDEQEVRRLVEALAQLHAGQ
jgi:hypothetical protein